MDRPKMASTKKRKGPGRPGGLSKLSDEILDVAEIMFADFGFAGTSMRQVAEVVEANPSLISYYFSNKENLFRAVFLRRGLKISEERVVRLEALEKKGNYTPRDLVRAFLEPPEKLRGSKQGRAFLRLHARMHMEPEEISYDLRRQVYQASTEAFASSFARLLPQLPLITIHHKISLMIGAYLYAFSDTNRLQEFCAPDWPKPAREQLLEDVIEFVTAGMIVGATAAPRSLKGAGF